MKHTSKKLDPRILEEASDWFVEFSEGEVDADARQRFDTWLRRSPEHVQAYLKITALWEDAPLLEKSRTLGSSDLVARAIAETNVVSLNATSVPQTVVSPEAPGSRSAPVPAGTQVPRRSTVRLFAIAASVLLTVAATTTYLYVQRDTYSTTLGEQRSVRLSDGSTIEINSLSRIRVRFRDDERLVYLLEGQALFQVAKDEARPFIVDTDGTRVRAVGTRFDVYRKESGTTVTVIEGKVSVASSAQYAGAQRRSGAGEEGRSDPVALQSVLLTAGQRLTVTPIALAVPEPANIEIATAWTRREIVFQSSPLSEAIEEFNRYNERKIVVLDPNLQEIRISGVFSSTDPNSLLRFLRELPNFAVQEDEDGIRISGR